tara:strand:- start:1994 stop:2260 length:267 start_codon:yes stop_codon:yes gene_type:complete
MVQGTKNDTDINLAVYMERLDAYIESQNALNQTLCSSIERVNNNLDELRMWRSRIYGGKTVIIALGVLLLHTTAIMGSFVALINYMNK